MYFNWDKCKLETISFGHGITTTPLQAAAAYATITNGGFLVKPTLKYARDTKNKPILFTDDNSASTGVAISTDPTIYLESPTKEREVLVPTYIPEDFFVYFEIHKRFQNTHNSNKFASIKNKININMTQINLLKIK